MVKAPSLGLLVATMCCIASCASAPSSSVSTFDQPQQQHHHHHQHQYPQDNTAGITLEDSNGDFTRSERSAGMARKIQFFVKNFHMQILPDGTVNGTLDDGSVYTILQRTAVGIGKLKIQGVGTCQYLCMDACGFLYGSRDFNDECVFNEMIQEHHYNTYSSTRYSNEKRTMYLALNRRGTPRKVLLHAGHPLGRLSSYTRVLTRTVPPQKLEDLHPVRHHGHACPSDPVKTNPQQNTGGPNKCRRHKRRKKRKRKCVNSSPEGGALVVDDDKDSEPCNVKRQRGKQQQQQQLPMLSSSSNSHSNINFDRHSNSSIRCESDGSDECQRVVQDGGALSAKKPSSAKTKLGDRLAASGAKKKKLQLHHKGSISKVGRQEGRKRLKTTTPLPTLEDGTEEGDYLDGTTALDWDDPTAAPTPEEAAAATLPD